MNVVTGAFGYIGRYITRRLLEQGEIVKTITTHPGKPNPFGQAVQAEALDFSRPEGIVRALDGTATLYNTYWIRFPYAGATFEQAVENTAILFHCARLAGVKRIVHISVTNASLESSLPYYKGKAQQEQALAACGVPYAIVRPTLVFGREDILVNNIAWLMRRFPLFPVFSTGTYRLQPVYVDDLAQITIDCARQSRTMSIDAIGPEIFTFYEFASLMAAHIRPGLPLVHLPPGLGITLGSLIGKALGDVLLTRDELQGLMDEMLTSTQAANGATRFSDWLAANKDTVGTAYTSEVRRHFHWQHSI